MPKCHWPTDPFTATAAYQFKQEASKGTLQPGKLADLVILDRNPLNVEPTAMKDIAVVRTIKEGEPCAPAEIA